MAVQETGRHGDILLTLNIEQQDFRGARRLQERLASPNLTTAYVNAEQLVNTLADQQADGWKLQLVKGARQLKLFGWEIQVARKGNIRSVRLPTE